MIGVYRMAQAKTVGQHGSSQQSRIGCEEDERQCPYDDVEGDQECVNTDHFRSNVGRTVVEDVGKCGKPKTASHEASFAKYRRAPYLPVHSHNRWSGLS